MDRKAQAAWDRIEGLGGYGVWDKTMVVASLAKTGVTDDDLALFRDFPYIQILDLSHTSIGDAGLTHLVGLESLDELVVVDTKISAPCLEAFGRDHPAVRVTTVLAPRPAVNPFTGRPF